jgi:hypothetical protein
MFAESRQIQPLLIPQGPPYRTTREDFHQR